MRYAGTRIPAADVGNPLPKDCGVHQGIDPHGVADLGATKSQLDDRFAWDHCYFAGCKHLHTVIGNFEQGVLQIDGFTFHVDGDDLSTPVGH